MFSVNIKIFISSFPIYIHSVFFPCLVALARSSSVLMNTSGESRIFALFLF